MCVLLCVCCTSVRANTPAGSGSPAPLWRPHCSGLFCVLRPPVQLGDSGGQESVFCSSEPRAWRLTWPSQNECVGTVRKVQGEDHAPLRKDEVTGAGGGGGLGGLRALCRPPTVSEHPVWWSRWSHEEDREGSVIASTVFGVQWGRVSLGVSHSGRTTQYPDLVLSAGQFCP